MMSGTEERAQSESIGIILLAGVIVLSIGTAGAFYLPTLDDGGDRPLFSIEGDTDPPNVTITHAGGDSVGTEELRLSVEVNGSRVASPRNGDEFEPGETWSVNVSKHVTTGSVVGVTLYHVPSGSRLYSEEWTIGEDWTRTATPTATATATPTATATATPTYPPTARLSAPDSTAVGRPTTLDASGSYDPDGGNASLEYRWDFDGDGTVDHTTTRATVSHTYWQSGNVTVTVTVVDDEGDTASATETITVNAAVRMGVSPESSQGRTDVDLLGLVGRSPDAALVNFSETTVSSYAGQDSDGNYEVADDGRRLTLRNNTWKKVPYSYEMTPDTVVAVDFRSPDQGEIQGIGLDNDNSQSSGLTYELYGTQNWGIARYDYAPSAPGWERFRITAGQDYTVDSQYLVFLNDDDNSGGDAVSQYRDVMVYEDDTATYDYAWDVGRDGTTDFTGKQPTRSLAPGTYDVTLTVSYAGNGSVVGAVNRTITIENEEPPIADFEYSPSSPTIDESVSFGASNSTDPDGGDLSYVWNFGDGSANATGVSPSYSYDESGNYTVTLTATDDEGETTTTTKKVEVEPEFVTAINAGGNSYTAADGTTYQGDPGCSVFDGQDYSVGSGQDITNTSDDPLYRSECYGTSLTYDNGSIENGQYVVTLQFAEIYFTSNGSRVFDVEVDGRTVIDDLDIHERVGHDQALTLTVPVNVTDGSGLTVTLESQGSDGVNNAKVSALKIERVGPTPPDTTPPSVTVDAPNGGETFAAGETTTIEWSASHSRPGVSSVDIAYSTDAGSTWTTIATGETNDGSYDWTVPNVDSDEVLVRVTATDGAGNTANDTSDGTFTVSRSGLTATSTSDLLSGESGQEQTLSFTLVGDLPAEEEITIDLSDAQASKGNGKVSQVNYRGATVSETSNAEFTTQKNSEAVITFTAGQYIASGETISLTITDVETAEEYSAKHTVTFDRSDASNAETATFTVKLAGSQSLSGDYDGDVYVDGDATVLEGATVEGNVTSGSEVQVNEGGEITGSVTSEEGVDVNEGGSVGGDVGTDGSVTAAGPVGGNVTTDGDVTLQEGGDIAGNVTTDGELKVNEDGAVDGSVVSDGDVDVNEGGSIGGDVETNGSLTTAGPVRGNVIAVGEVKLQEGGDVAGDITTDGDVQINEGGTVQGDVTAGGEVDINEGGVIEGDVYVDSADDIVCAEGATINGQPCEEYVDENY